MEILTSSSYLEKILKEEIICCYVPIKNKTVLSCMDSNINEEEAQKRQYIIEQVPMKGGGIVLSEGDIAFGFSTTDFNRDYRSVVLGTIQEELLRKGLNVQLNKNDILIDDKKVVGYAQAKFSSILGVAIAVSMNANLDDIQAICTKEISKIPGSLSEYNIIQQDLIEIFYKIERKILYNYIRE